MLAFAACGGDLVLGQLPPAGADASTDAQGGAGSTPDGGEGPAEETGAPTDCNGAITCQRTVFVTSTTFKGLEIGGLAGADSKCQSAAEQAPVGGPVRGKRFHAWLSTYSNSVVSRIPHGTAYVLADVAKTPVASDFRAFVGPPALLAHAITIDEKGAPQLSGPEVFVWTGTGEGGIGAEDDCLEWSAGDATVAKGQAGNGMSTDSTWTAYASEDCSQLAHLYCFED
jgi:hypothetical protein